MLKAANKGKAIAFDKMMDFAYGRKGKLRWELLEVSISPPCYFGKSFTAIYSRSPC